MSRTEKRIDKLWCRLFGHHLVDGPRYRNSSTSGCSKICHRCGYYEVLLDDDHEQAKSDMAIIPIPDIK